MSRWLVTQGDHQFSAQDLSELKELVSSGRLGPGDMVQPPGASDWLYVSELPELSELLGANGASDDDDDDWEYKSSRSKVPMAVVLAVVAIVGAVGMVYYGSRMPSQEDLQLIGGTSGLQLTEMISSTNASVRAEPAEGAATVGSIEKDSTLKLLGKRGDWYNIQNSKGVSGFVKADEVVPAYYFADAETRQSHDPIYNPDRYVFVKNSSWMQLPDQREENITIFHFLLQNKSKFEMTDLKLLATIRDKNDRVIETKEIAIEGTLPEFDGMMVGTLRPAKDDLEGTSIFMTTGAYEARLKADESLVSRWEDGVHTMMDSEGFVEANIDLLQVRAVPKEL
jgi:hypothetical protein